MKNIFSRLKEFTTSRTFDYYITLVGLFFHILFIIALLYLAISNVT